MCIQHTPAPNAAQSHTHTSMGKISRRAHIHMCDEIHSIVALRSRGAYSSILFLRDYSKSFSDSPLTALLYTTLLSLFQSQYCKAAPTLHTHGQRCFAVGITNSQVENNNIERDPALRSTVLYIKCQKKK